LDDVSGSIDGNGSQYEGVPRCAAHVDCTDSTDRYSACISYTSHRTRRTPVWPILRHRHSIIRWPAAHRCVT